MISLSKIRSLGYPLITKRPRNEVSGFSVLVLERRKGESGSEWLLKVIISVSYIYDVKGFVLSN